MVDPTALRTAEEHARIVADMIKEYGSLPKGGGGGTSGPMDPWQQTVETRLADLKTEVRAVGADTSSIKVDLATLKERVAHLPSKGFIIQAVVSLAAFIAALSAFGPWLRHFLHLPE